MHELGMCEAIVDAVVWRAQGRKVTRIRVHIGRLHRVEPDAFAQSFALAALGTPAEAAAADLVFTPVRGECRACGASYVGDDVPPACPSCARDGIAVTGGDELLVESIQYAGTVG